MRSLAAAFLLVLDGASATAQDLTEQDREAIEVMTEASMAATERGDVWTALDLVPPPIAERQAKAIGMSVPEATDALQAYLDEVREGVTLVSYELFTDQIAEGVTAGGRSYALIPDKTVMDLGDRLWTQESTAVALEDGAPWYPFPVPDEENVALLRSTHPDFEDVDFPPSRTTMTP